MTRIHLFLLCCLCLLVVGCSGVEEQGITAVIPIPSTVAPTATPLPATETPVVTETAVIPIPNTAAPTATQLPATETPKLTVAAMLTSTTTPQPTATLTDTHTLLPPPPGEIYFFWDPTTFNGGVPPAAPKHNLFLATPGETASEWHVETLLDKALDWSKEAPSFPQVALSPDQTKLALITWFDAGGDGDVHTEVPGGVGDLTAIQVYDLSKDTLSLLMDYSPLEYRDLTWLPDNTNLFFGWGKEVYSVGLDGLPPKSMTPSFSQNVGSILASPNGDFVTIWISSGNLYLLDTDSDQIVNLLSDNEASHFVNMSWDPNSQWFAFSPDSSETLFIIDTNAFNIQPIAQPGLTLPVWSPEGSKLAFKQSVNNRTDLFIWHIENQTTTHLVGWDGVQSSDPVWSPDGRYISLGLTHADKASLHIIDVFTGDEKWVEWEAMAAGYPTWSPDSSRIAMSLTNGEKGALSIVAFEPESLAEIFSIDEEEIEGLLSVSPHKWSPDGEWLLFSGVSKNNNNLYVVNENVSEVQTVLEIPTNTVGPINFFWLSE